MLETDGGSAVTSLPTTPKGQRTRAALLIAARAVFEREGFLDARITDITKEAGLANGSFYTYFVSKEQIFSELAQHLQEEQYQPGPANRSSDVDEHPVSGIERANRRYLVAYMRNARLMGLVEQVATFNEELRSVRKKRADAFMARAAAHIRSLQDRGLVPSDIDPDYSGFALTAMVSRYAYLWLVERNEFGRSFDLDRSVEVLTVLWANALRLSTEGWVPAERETFESENSTD